MSNPLEHRIESVLQMPAWEHLREAARLISAPTQDPMSALLLASIHAQFATVKTVIDRSEETQEGIQPPLDGDSK